MDLFRITDLNNAGYLCSGGTADGVMIVWWCEDLWLVTWVDGSNDLTAICGLCFVCVVYYSDE